MISGTISGIGRGGGGEGDGVWVAFFLPLIVLSDPAEEDPWSWRLDAAERVPQECCEAALGAGAETDGRGGSGVTVVAGLGI